MGLSKFWDYVWLAVLLLLSGGLLECLPYFLGIRLVLIPLVVVYYWMTRELGQSFFAIVFGGLLMEHLFILPFFSCVSYLFAAWLVYRRICGAFDLSNFRLAGGGAGLMIAPTLWLWLMIVLSLFDDLAGFYYDWRLILLSPLVGGLAGIIFFSVLQFVDFSALRIRKQEMSQDE